MFRTYLCAAFAIGVISVTAVCGIDAHIKSQEAMGAAIVKTHSDTVMAMLRNNAEAMCPGVPKDPLYAEIRTAYQCERFGL